LTGTAWKLVQVGASPLATASPDDRAPFIQFDQQSQASGYSGVNNFSGSYLSDRSSLKFGPVIMTRRAGSPAQMEIESALMKALGDTQGYRISGSTLDLLDANGKPLARFDSTPIK